MRGTVAAAVFASLLPGGAAALSCEEYSITAAYWSHQARPETFVLALGSFRDLELVSQTRTVATDTELTGGSTVYTAQFEGFLASTRAFDQPFSAQVTLAFPDYSMLGGGYDSATEAAGLPGKTGLVWLMKTDAGYQAKSELCAVLLDTEASSIQPALKCLSGRRCPKQ